MPLEAGALLLDVVGWGKPVWIACGWSIDALLTLAHKVAATRGAVALLPSMPSWAYALMVSGGIWICLWTTRARLLGWIPILIGAAAAAQVPAPDLLVTGDGRHLAVIQGATPFLLRDRAGDYVRQLFAETAGFDGDPDLLDGQPGSDCSHDACVAMIRKADAQWRLLATRSSTLFDWDTVRRACADADIVVSDRRLPAGCAPRWLKLDSATLRRTGGVAIYLGKQPRVDTVASHVGQHPWVQRNQ